MYELEHTRTLRRCTIFLTMISAVIDGAIRALYAMCQRSKQASTGNSSANAPWVRPGARPRPKTMSIPCKRTLKSWCNQGFESWLACQNGTGQLSWTLKKSKFSHRQVLEWFSFKDELFKNRSTSSDLSDASDTGKLQALVTN